MHSSTMDKYVQAMWAARCRYFGEKITPIEDLTRIALFEEYVYAVLEVQKNELNENSSL